MRPAVLLLLLAPVLAWPAVATGHPADAAPEIARLLYHPVHTIEIRGDTVAFRADSVTYRPDSSFANWTVRREPNPAPRRLWPFGLELYRDPTRPDVVWRFRSPLTADAVWLEIWRADRRDSVRAARVKLWDRWQVARAWIDEWRRWGNGTTERELAKGVLLGAATIPDIADDGRYLWLPIEYYAGEGELGIGTLVRFDRRTNEIELYQPEALAFSSLSHVALAGGSVWLGTRHHGEGGDVATVGLARIDPLTGEVATLSSSDSPLVGRLVTALRVYGNSLWIATDEGFNRITWPGEQWSAWRIVPTVRLRQPTPMTRVPGTGVESRIGPGAFQVRWVARDHLEVVTRDGVQGWVPSERLAEPGHLGLDAYALANFHYGGPSPLGVHLEARAEAPIAAFVYRVEPERIALRTADGWQRVRVRAGWIPRAGLEVELRVVPITDRPR